MERKILHDIDLPPSLFLLPKKYGIKRYRIFNLRVKRVNPSMTGRRADAKLFGWYHHEHPEPGAARYRSRQRGELHVSRQQRSRRNDESDCESESTV